MKLSVLTVPFYGMPLEDTLKYLHGLGVEQVELGAGGFPGNTHTRAYMDGEKKPEELLELLNKYGMSISAISVHGNCVHPDKSEADRFQRDYEAAVLFAEKLGVDTLVTFSGCPGGSPADATPNWVVCPWPEDFLHVLDYQWNEVLIPYWEKAVAFANDHGVKKIALEMHPGFCVYNTETCLKLRAAVGDTIGANFDPSHLIWQGMDPVAAIRYLGGSIYHFHAKDTRIDAENTAKIGVLDTKHYGNFAARAWSFRTVGYGMDERMWREMMTALQTVGYDGAISIEHEDGMMSINEGLEKAAALLRRVIIRERAGEMWWA